MDYTRVILRSNERRANLVIPSAEPVGAVLPRLVDLLGEAPDGDGTLTLTTELGSALDNARSLADQSVTDGSLLLLTRTDTAPPPPEVSDVTEAVVEHRAHRLDLWSRTWATRVGAVVLAILGAAAGVGLIRVVHAAAGLVALALVVVAMVLLRWVRRWPAAGVAGLAIGCSAATGALLSLMLRHASAHPLTMSLLGGWALAWLAAAVTFGVAARQRCVLIGGAAGFLAGLGGVVLLVAGLSQTRAAAALGVVALLALGLVPAMAMSLSGLSRIDDDAVVGGSVERTVVQQGVSEAYATLSWLVIALALPLGYCSVVLGQSRSPFALALGVCLTVVVACRARFLPLAGPLLACGAVVAAGLVAILANGGLPGWAAPVAVVVLIALLLAVVGWHPAAHVAARLRITASIVELIATVATVPLLLAVFHVFQDLLRVWHV